MLADPVPAIAAAPKFTLFGGPDSRDWVWIVTLGAAARQPLTADAARNAVWEIADFKWSPTRDFLVSCMHDMVQRGCLAVTAEPDGEDRLITTLKGRKTLRHLLAVPVDGTGGTAGQFAIRLRLAFLDLLPPADRTRVIDALIGAHESEITRQKANLAILWVGPHGRDWLDRDRERLDRDRERLDRDLARLRKVRAALGCGRACRGCSCSPHRH